MKSYILILLIFTYSKLYAFDENKTYGLCSPIITGSVNSDVVIKCKNKKGSVNYSVTMKNSTSPYNPLIYKKRIVNGNIEIFPIFSINTSLYDYDENNDELKYFFPTLDFKILNNTDQSIVIDYVKININKSELFKSPYIRYGEYMVETYCSDPGLTFSNIGNILAEDVTIHFNITSAPKDIFSDEKISLNFENLKYKRKFNIDKMSIKKINIDKEIENEGVNFSKITLKERSSYSAYIQCKNIDNDQSYCKNYKKIYEKVIKNITIGKFGNKKNLVNGDYREPFIYGYIKYNFFNPFMKKFEMKKQKFRAYVNLFPFSECGGGLNISEEYYYKLQTEGINYTIDANNISHIIKSEDADRFTLTLGVEKSSFHMLEVRIHTVELGYLPSKKIKIFIPVY